MIFKDYRGEPVKYKETKEAEEVDAIYNPICVDITTTEPVNPNLYP